MRGFLFVLTACCVIALAFWAYRENYATQAALSQTEQLHRDIRAAHSRLSVLRAEWAYLNRPDRLRDLVDLNFDRVQLLPFRPEQFGDVSRLPFAPQPLESEPLAQPITAAGDPI